MAGDTPLKTDFVLTDAKAESKEQVLKTLAAEAAKGETVKNLGEKKIYEMLKAREDLGSTGFGDGIAIPHCSMDGIDNFVVGLMLVPAGVDFGAVDGKPARVLFLIIGPKEQRNRHIKILSAISKMMKTEGVVDRLFSYTAEDEVKNFLQEHLTIREEKPNTEGYCLINVYVQKEEIFDDILELLSAEVEGSITVLENQNAGSYLRRLPLFSSYWTEGSAAFNRLIQAVLPRSKCNNLIRRINLIEDSFAPDPGIMITAVELMYASGSIDF
jgi:mannitol/fructose-specific phosphotransferase system IIA component (Ntr-type)